MAEAKEVNGIDLTKLNKVVTVDRACDDDGRNGYWEEERTTLYEDDSNPRSLRYYVAREYANQCFDDKCVFEYIVFQLQPLAKRNGKRVHRKRDRKQYQIQDFHHILRRSVC